MTATTDVPGGLKSVGWGLVTEALTQLGHGGVGEVHLRRLANDPIWAQEIASGIISSAFREPFLHEFMRRKFPPGHFFGIREWQEMAGAEFAPADIAQVSLFPWPPNILLLPDPWDAKRTIAETHFAFLGLTNIRRGESTSLLNVDSLRGLTFTVKHSRETTCQVNLDASVYSAVATFYCEFGWNLARLEPVEVPGHSSYQHEQAFLGGRGYRTAPLAEELTKRVLYAVVSEPGEYFPYKSTPAFTRSFLGTQLPLRVAVFNAMWDRVHAESTNQFSGESRAVAVFRHRPPQPAQIKIEP